MRSSSYDELSTEPRWAENLSSVYVGDELHFRWRTFGVPASAELPGDARNFIPKYIDALVIMQKVDGAWHIHEIGDEVYHH